MDAHTKMGFLWRGVARMNLSECAIILNLVETRKMFLEALKTNRLFLSIYKFSGTKN